MDKYAHCFLVSTTQVRSYYFLDILLEISLFQFLWFIIILILAVLLVFNHILHHLASFDFYCGSNAVHKGLGFGCVRAPRALQAQHILWMDLFLAILFKWVCSQKNCLLQYYLKSCIMTKNIICPLFSLKKTL